MVFNVFNYYTCSFPESNTLGQIGNFSFRIGKKTYFLALGMGPNFGPKFRRSRALHCLLTILIVMNCCDPLTKEFQYFVVYHNSVAMRQCFFLSKQFQRSISLLKDGSRSLELLWNRKPHFIPKLYKSD